MTGFFAGAADFLAYFLTSVYFLLLLLSALIFFLLRAWYISMKTAALEKLRYHRYFTSDGVFEGDNLRLVEELQNVGLFPLFFVRLDFFVPEGLMIDRIECRGLMKLTSVFNLPPHSTVKKIHEVTALRREHYILETASIKYRKNAFDFSSRAELYVYPGRYDAPVEIQPDILRVGDTIAARRYIEDPFFFSGIREYRFGDPVRGINFKATAKLYADGRGRLMSSSYDSSRSHGAMIFLDLTPYPEVCTAEEISSMMVEAGLRCACYLFAETVLNGGLSGFCANSSVGTSRYIYAPCGDGREHAKRILECFAEITHLKRRDYSFLALLQSKVGEVPKEADIYVLTPYIDERAAEFYRELERARSFSIITYLPGGVAGI